MDLSPFICLFSFSLFSDLYLPRASSLQKPTECAQPQGREENTNMADVQDITLTATQQAELARISQASGKPWPAVLAEALAAYQAMQNGKGKRQTSLGVRDRVSFMADDFEAPLPEF